MKKSTIKLWLEEGLNPTRCRLHAKLIKQLRDEFSSRLVEKNDRKQFDLISVQTDFIELMIHWVENEIEQLSYLQSRFNTFADQFSHAISDNEKQQHVLDFAKNLGATKLRLRGDAKAFKRWFGGDAVSERFHRLSAEKGRDVAFVLRQIGVFSVKLLSKNASPDEIMSLWKRLWLEKFLSPLLEYQQFEPIRIAAFHCLVESLHCLPESVHQTSVSDNTLRYVYRCSLDKGQDVWLQAEALKLLAEISPANFSTALEKRLLNPIDGDDLFVRRQMVRLFGEKISHLDNSGRLLSAVLVDPSPAVRQLIISSLSSASVEILSICLYPLCCEDKVVEVRGTSILSCLDLLQRGDCIEIVLSILEQAFQYETEALVKRICLEVVAEGYDELTSKNITQAKRWHERLIPFVHEYHQNADEISVCRHAARIIERLWVSSDEKIWTLTQRLQLFISDLPEGQIKLFPKDLIEQVNQPYFGRILAYLAQEDFGFDVQLGSRPKIMRGHIFGFRSWRLLHEFRFPSTDKRQAFRHTTGRIFRGDLRVPSGILAELAETKVPGEPLFMAKENDWRPYLPLVDELISGLDLPLYKTTLTLCTSEGQTIIHLPNSFRKRLIARTKLTLKFAYYAQLRNWKEEEGQMPDQYLSQIRQLGFRCEFLGYRLDATQNVPLDTKVGRFFPAILPIGFFTNFDVSWFERPKEYFFSLYENTLSELILFILVAASWFVGRHIYLYYLIKKARAAMPLVIGGWGTRGKSGTERLKAALFNALGYNVVSKTSGCEAMFVYGYAHGSLREMFLFRPYDKATIW